MVEHEHLLLLFISGKPTEISLGVVFFLILLLQSHYLIFTGHEIKFKMVIRTYATLIPRRSETKRLRVLQSMF